jgi:hypothetical protein
MPWLCPASSLVGHLVCKGGRWFQNDLKIFLALPLILDYEGHCHHSIIFSDRIYKIHMILCFLSFLMKLRKVNPPTGGGGDEHPLNYVDPVHSV